MTTSTTRKIPQHPWRRHEALRMGISTMFLFWFVMMTDLITAFVIVPTTSSSSKNSFFVSSSRPTFGYLRASTTSNEGGNPTNGSRRDKRRDAERRRRRIKFLQNNNSSQNRMDIDTWRQEKQESLMGGVGAGDQPIIIDSEILRRQANVGSSRRTFFARSIPLCAAATTLCGSELLTNPEGELIPPANAASNSKDPYEGMDLRSKIKASFQAIKDELSSDIPFKEMGKGGGVPYLKSLIAEQNWNEIKEFTKFYDGEFRKAKLGYVRKKIMVDKKQKEQSTLLSNAVTFDLIGINRAARSEDSTEAMRYLDELTNDINDFLKFEQPLLDALN